MFCELYLKVIYEWQAGFQLIIQIQRKRILSQIDKDLQNERVKSNGMAYFIMSILYTFFMIQRCLERVKR